MRKRMPVTALADPKIVLPAIGSAFVKLDPRPLMKNPVMFVVEIVAALTTMIFVRDGCQAATISASPVRSFSGCGSPCCSPISPKRSPRVAARRRPTTLRQTRTETKAKLPDRRPVLVLKLVPGTSG